MSDNQPQREEKRREEDKHYEGDFITNSIKILLLERSC
jgi:hypothetical protein